jgi:hypothetical protein
MEVAPTRARIDSVVGWLNWGIRGQNAADLTLNYRVEV